MGAVVCEHGRRMGGHEGVKEVMQGSWEEDGRSCRGHVTSSNIPHDCGSDTRPLGEGG